MDLHDNMPWFCTRCFRLILEAIACRWFTNIANLCALQWRWFDGEHVHTNTCRINIKFEPPAKLIGTRAFLPRHLLQTTLFSTFNPWDCEDVEPGLVLSRLMYDVSSTLWSLHFPYVWTNILNQSVHYQELRGTNMNQKSRNCHRRTFTKTHTISPL